tara:strand:+ start:46 stop:408 length:363 start_codon:yes stop_codon:yes gene_type:complete
MRVKLQYSVDLEEVPAEARSLFSRANAEIQDAGDHMDDVFIVVDSSTDYDNVLDSIEQARKNLAEADFRLGDAQAILAGYLQVKHAPAQEGMPLTDIDRIKDQISDLKHELPDADEEQDE